MKCYEFKLISFKHGIFDNSLDATYILHLENNGRLSNIKKQLQKIKPTKKVFIYYNKGFKKCKKNNIQNTNQDIIHSNIEICKHSQKNQFKNILVLEDNFIFDRELVFKENIININNFIHINQQKRFMLSLGCLPIFITPSTQKNVNYSLLSLGIHNMIYTQKFQKYILENEKKIYMYGDWDNYSNYFSNKYIYYKPLIYQRFEETENQKNWVDILYIKKLTLKYLAMLEFQKNPKQAFKRHYQLCIFFQISLLLLIIYLIYLFIKRFN